MVVGTPQKDSWEAQMGSAFRRLNLRQILFTLAMLSLFQLGQYIPLPGISLETIANLVDSGGMDRISILALGIVPWVSAAIIVFAAGLIVPAISRSCFRNHHVNIYHPLVILLAILIAIPQAYGIHVGLQAASGIIDPQAGSFNSYAIIASLIGGVAISIFIANMIDTHGTGLGIWLLMGLPFLSGILDNFSMLIELSRQGVMPLLPFFLIDLGYLVFVILACCLLVLLLRNNKETGFGSIFWPLLLASHLTGFVLLAVNYLIPDFYRSVILQGALAFQVVFDLVWILLLIILIVWRSRKFEIPGVLIPLLGILIALIAMPNILEASNTFLHTPWYFSHSVQGTIAAIAALAWIVFPQRELAE